MNLLLAEWLYDIRARLGSLNLERYTLGEERISELTMLKRTIWKRKFEVVYSEWIECKLLIEQFEQEYDARFVRNPN